MQGKLSPVVVNSYQPLREIVCEVLRDAIRGGILKPGEWLKENDLADELLVSRTPVREAIRKLEQLLYQAARNERLLAIIGNLREQLTRFRTISMSYPGRLKATLEEHRAIVDAIGAGDARHARKVGAKHMENSERTLLYAIEEQEKKTGTTLVKRKHKKSKEGME